MDSTIEYRTSVDGIRPGQLTDFFEGWPNPPSQETHLRLLENSDEVVIALDSSSDAVVGFVTAITDRVLSAYIPLLEVVPAFHGRGIGSELVRILLERLGGLYMIDLTCDASLQPFYSRFGMKPSTGMLLRRYEHQSGATGLEA